MLMARAFLLLITGFAILGCPIAPTALWADTLGSPIQTLWDKHPYSFDNIPLGKSALEVTKWDERKISSVTDSQITYKDTLYQAHRADLTYRLTDGQCSGVTLLIYDVSTSDIQTWAEEYTSLLGHSQIHQYSEDGRFIQRWKSGDWVVNLNQNIGQATARLSISYFKPGTMPAQLTQMLHEFPFPDFKANQQCDFRRLSWGMTQEQVEALEYLAPSATGINPSGTIYHIYGYTNCMGKRARLTHNFLSDQYVRSDYLISGSSIEEYKEIRADLENYYGAPALADEAKNISYAGWSLPDKFLNLVFYPEHSQYGSLFTLTFVDPKHPEVQDGLF